MGIKRRLLKIKTDYVYSVVMQWLNDYSGQVNELNESGVEAFDALNSAIMVALGEMEG